MAIYHLAADIVRRSVGRTVTAAAAYRAGECITDQRTGLAFDYRPRRGVVHAEIIAPDDAPGWMHDRAALWNAVEAAEKRKDAQLARDIELALPHELAPAARLDLVRGFVRAAFVDAGMVADIAIHAPRRRDADRRNHHAHILLTMRAIDGDGFGAKVRAWNDVALLEQWRALWAEHVNRALELAGESARVDHRSLAAQGIERVAGIHLGPVVVELAARGIETERAELAQEIEAINTALAEIEEPARVSPPATVITLAPGCDLMRRRRNAGRGIAAAFRTAARMVWGRIRRAVRPPPARSLQHRKPKIA
jgi:ATP-dependent exoDNAse (exonuclease V) alpha subunit